MQVAETVDLTDQLDSKHWTKQVAEGKLKADL
jgi:hypothetical protein